MQPPAAKRARQRGVPKARPDPGDKAQSRSSPFTKPAEKRDEQLEQQAEQPTNGGTSNPAVIDATGKKVEYPLSHNLKSSSRYFGVGFHSNTGRWQASYNTKYVGLYDTEEEAAKARWEYAQTREPEDPVASIPITKLLFTKQQPAAAAPSAPQPVKRQASEVPPTKAIFRTKEPDAKRAMSQFFSGSKPNSSQLATVAQPAARPTANSSAGSIFQQLSVNAAPKPVTLEAAKQVLGAAKKPARKKSAAQDQQRCAPEQRAGKEKDAAQQERMDRLENATPAEEAQMKQWLRTFHSWMLARDMKESTVRTYVYAFRLLYEIDRKSPTAMATQEYWHLSKVGSNHRAASSVSFWSEFFCDHRAKKAPLEPSSDAAMYQVRSREEFEKSRELRPSSTAVATPREDCSSYQSIATLEEPTQLGTADLKIETTALEPEASASEAVAASSSPRPLGGWVQDCSPDQSIATPQKSAQLGTAELKIETTAAEPDVGGEVTPEKSSRPIEEPALPAAAKESVEEKVQLKLQTDMIEPPADEATGVAAAGAAQECN